jgi:hypothetical protein
MHEVVLIWYELRNWRRYGVYRRRAENALLLVLAGLVLMEAEEIRSIVAVEYLKILQIVLTCVR